MQGRDIVQSLPLEMFKTWQDQPWGTWFKLALLWPESLNRCWLAWGLIAFTWLQGGEKQATHSLWSEETEISSTMKQVQILTWKNLDLLFCVSKLMVVQNMLMSNQITGKFSAKKA